MSLPHIWQQKLSPEGQHLIRSGCSSKGLHILSLSPQSRQRELHNLFNAFKSPTWQNNINAAQTMTSMSQQSSESEKDGLYIHREDPDQEEKMDDSDTEPCGILDNVKQFIEGCESFVTKQIAEVRAKQSLELVSETSAVSKRLDQQIDEMEKRLTNEIEALKGEVSKRKNLEEFIDERINKKVKALSEINDIQKLESDRLRNEVHDIRGRCRCQQLGRALAEAATSSINQEEDIVNIFLVNSDHQQGGQSSLEGYNGDIDEQRMNEIASVMPLQTVDETDSEIAGPSGLIHLTSPTLKDVTELPEPLQNGVKKFIRSSPLATKEKLSNLQAAYIRHFVENVPPKSKPRLITKDLLEKGVRDRIWANNFVPPGTKDFPKYLLQRVKNEIAQKKALELKRFGDNQQRRLQKEVDDIILS